MCLVEMMRNGMKLLGVLVRDWKKGFWRSVKGRNSIKLKDLNFD